MEDLEFLQKQWEVVQIQANSLRPPSLLNRDDDFIQRVLRDMYSGEVNRIVVDSVNGVKRVKQQLMNWEGGRALEGVFIDAHRERQPILDYFRVNAAIKEALRPRVELPSGGYLIIQPTEALTVIDVNSGSFTKSATARETVAWTNSEAATEIARQLRLRNIGGVVIVDFIDMDSRRDQLKLLEHFNKALRADKARPQIAQLSELGLVELTRKRQGKNIYELFGKTCPTCGGLGYLAHLPGEPELQCLETSVVIPSIPTIIPPSRFVESEFEDSKDLGGYNGEKGFEVAEETPSNIDLLHHPNYQEQGAASNIRRRRRRIGEEQKEEIPSRPIPKEIEVPTPREQRDRHISYRGRREEIPVEKVTIDMTPLEQELYALMGVSPLIRVEQQFKNPRCVQVTINSVENQPYQKLSDDDGEEIVEDISTEAESLVEDSFYQQDEDQSDLISVSKGAENLSDFEELQQDLTDQLTPEIEEIEDDNLEGDDEDQRPIVRRRRRRSSAQ